MSGRDGAARPAGAGGRPLAVVLVSGGLDSCVCAAEAAREHELALLHVTYGQRTAARERRAFDAIADHFRAGRRLATTLPALRDIGGSSLTDAARPVEEGLPAGGAVPSTYVPFRNAHLLAAGVSWGEVLGARALYIGAVEEDGSGYPDCRPEFIEAFQRAIDLGTAADPRITLMTPFVRMSKVDIVRTGLALGVPYEETWSCYQKNDRACGVCSSCHYRREAFRELGLEDPIEYRR